MFHSISGAITGRGPNTLYVTTAGVEWELEVSGFTLRELARENRARVFTHLHHREDQMRLYGFVSEEERRVFLELTKVSGIGPRAALKILSASSPERLIQLLETEDVDGLVLLPGLGQKTAQKIILTLRGRLVTQADAAIGAHGELVEGLTDMGFDRGAAAKAVGELASAVGAEQPDLTGPEAEQEIFRRAIVRLSEE
ncbi:MAG: Holliday junction branch migration protein RuvA [Spirochaetia bacterium]